MIINGNGIYTLNYTDTNYIGNESDRMLLVSGKLGKAVLTVGYENDNGVFIPFSDTPVKFKERFKVDHGLGVTPKLRVKGATSSTNLSVIVAGTAK